MFIHNEQEKNTLKLMKRIGRETEEQKRLDREDVELCRELKRLNQMSGSIQRSKNKKKIERFNARFFQIIKRLSEIRQNQGTKNPKEIEYIINTWKKNHYAF